MASSFPSHRELARPVKPHSGLSSQLAHNEPTRSLRDLHESSIPQAVGENSENSRSPRHDAPELAHYSINTTTIRYTTSTAVPVVNERNTLLQPLTDRYCEQAIFSAQHIPECYGYTREPERLAPLLQDFDRLFDTPSTANNSRSVPGSPKSQLSSKADDSLDWVFIDQREAALDNIHANIAMLAGKPYSPMGRYLGSSFEDEPWVPRAALEYGSPYNPDSPPSEYHEE